VADQIYAPGPNPAPLKYNVPGSQQMIPRACQALFNGSGASGDYVPALIFRSQAGHVISRAILGSTVTAGDDAEVSWFPRVGGGGSSLVTINEQAAMWILSTDTPYTVDPGATWLVQFAHGAWFGDAITADIANGEFHLLKRWQFFLSASVLWEDTDFPRSIWISTPFGHGGGTLPQPTDFHDRTPAGTFTVSDPTGLGPLWCRDTMLIQPDAFFGGDLFVDLNVQNGDVVARNIEQAFFACYAVNFSG
jgi:hypothetical protein